MKALKELLMRESLADAILLLGGALLAAVGIGLAVTNFVLPGGNNLTGAAGIGAAAAGGAVMVLAFRLHRATKAAMYERPEQRGSESAERQ